MITYNDLYEALRKEKYSEQLQPIAKAFIKDVAEYLKDKEKNSKTEGNMFSESSLKTKKQSPNSKTEIPKLKLQKIQN